jgi:hypothetical protein
LIGQGYRYYKIGNLRRKADHGDPAIVQGPLEAALGHGAEQLYGKPGEQNNSDLAEALDAYPAAQKGQARGGYHRGGHSEKQEQRKRLVIVLILQLSLMADQVDIDAPPAQDEEEQVDA